jgi:gamma-glutamyl hercynylcysteine S-oxide synthase
VTVAGVSLEQALCDLEVARRRTLQLTDVDEVELTRQHSPLMSPLVWDLAHIGQQEEHFLLHRLGWRERDATPVYAPAVAALYDAFTHPRASRVTLPLLSAPEARRHLQDVRLRVLDRLAGSDPVLDDPGGVGARFVAGLVVQHEQQHVETMLATHQLRKGTPLLRPAAATRPGVPGLRGDRAHAVRVPAGPARIGADPLFTPTALDNELPRHTVDLPAFRIGRVPVTNGQWQEFVADGGYGEARWWTAEGWAHRTEAGLVAPLFWAPDGAGGWTVDRFGEVTSVVADEPVQHVCFHEAQAYARWAGARLPTEFEWEKAAEGVPEPTADTANLDGHALGPVAVGSLPEGASAYGVEQLIGDVWEWTSSPLSPYPGFTPMIYDTYSAPFFGPEYRVLRGGSWATGRTAVRPTFRNWDFPIRRQIFSGVRLAWDD